MISPAAKIRIHKALDRLESVGFLFDDGFKFDWRTAAENFNSATLWKVFGLAQILKTNQPVTVRGAMYRSIPLLVADSSDPNYDCIANLVLKMRRLGLVPYEWIVDGTRISDKPSSWSGLADFAETVAHAYRKDLWERQPTYIEIFVEKDAMSGVIRPITREYDVKLNPIRGNCSETFVYETAKIWKQIEKPIQIYYLGDHDPAGLSIEADVRKRLENFCGFSVSWKRLAITEEDFWDNNASGNYAWQGFRTSNKRYSSAILEPYIERYGDRGVEVDAIPAATIRSRVEEAIEQHIDQREWEIMQQIEAEERKDLFAKIKDLG